jgi:uncharacterized protein (TIGR02246 family)
MGLKHLVTSLLVIALAGCSPAPQNPAPTAPPAAADTSGVDKIREAFMEAFIASDAARVADLYTADAVIMPQNQPAMTGHDAILNYNKGFFDTFNAKLTLTPEETKIFGDMAFDRGTYTMELTPKAGGAAIMDDGKYLVLLQHQADGSWKVFRDIDNSSRPAAPPPAAGK